MQAAKIVLGSMYAVKRGGQLCRFRVSEVITRRYGNATESQAIGVWLDGEGERSGTLPVSEIAGDYKAFAELVERQARETAAKEAKSKEEKRQSLADRLALYKFVGEKAPQKSDDYHQLFRVPSYGGVEVTGDGARAIVAHIRQHQDDDEIRNDLEPVAQ